MPSSLFLPTCFGLGAQLQSLSKISLSKWHTNRFPQSQNNYFIQVDDSLPWSSSIGPEAGSASWSTALKNKAISPHPLRSERQTLRRLPRSGGVVFTIRTYFHPITEICDE